MQRKLAAAGWTWDETESIVSHENSGGRVEVHPRAGDDNLLVAVFASDGREDEIHVELEGKFDEMLPVLSDAKDSLTVETFADFVTKVKAVCPRSVAFIDR